MPVQPTPASLRKISVFHEAERQPTISNQRLAGLVAGQSVGMLQTPSSQKP